jgi:hypothetical protein
MKYLITLTFIIFSLFVWSAIDPAPDNAEFRLDKQILNKGISILLFDSPENHRNYNEDSIQHIYPEIESYYFYFPGKYFRIKIQFSDSTEKVTSLIKNNFNYSIYKIDLNSDDKLVVTDITNYIETSSSLKFVVIFSFLFIIIKVLPTWIIFSPKDFSLFIKYYGLAQLTYSIVFSILTFFFHGIGLLFSILFFLIAIAIDKKILNKIFLNTKKSGSITGSIVTTLILTILFCIFELFAFVLL